MKIAVLSGKGGTGKTLVSVNLAVAAENARYIDCDVDAPNLHLVTLLASQEYKADFYGMSKAKIDPQLCVQCGKCRENCRFDAILTDGGYHVDPYACEGCGVCETVCPAKAVSMQPAVAGELMRYMDRNSVFSTAKLKMGSGNSGLLVTEVKKQMRDAAPTDTEFAIIDGSPGIGCPVIASLCGVNMVLVVTEPSVSGMSDLERILKTAEIFQTKAAVCINKYDTNLDNSQKIENFCKEKELPLVGKIPYDPDAVQAVNQRKTIAEVDCAAGHAAKEVFENTISFLLEDDARNRDGYESIKE